jgi:uncharacterized protein
MTSLTSPTGGAPPNSQPRLRFTIVPGEFAVSRLDPVAAIPEWALRPSNLMALVRTSDELSLVCPAEHVPTGTQAEYGWMCLKLIGPFPFSMTGILASFIAPLSSKQISILALATFDTDYVLIKEESWERARRVLQAAGHELEDLSGLQKS